MSRVIPVLSAITACAAVQAASSQFADIEIRASAPNTIPAMRARFAKGRLELRNATAVDLIEKAWGVNAEDVAGGPDWIDLDRFDIAATASPETTPAALNEMLQTLLRDQFRLATHVSTREIPAYVIRVEKKPALQPAEGNEPGGCQLQPGLTRSAPVAYACTNVTMEAFARNLAGSNQTSGYLFSYPVVDRTGLRGSWTFALRFSARNALLANPDAGNEITLFDAVEKFGLRLNLENVSIPSIVVDSVARPHVRQSPQSRLEFEVAEIKLEDPNRPKPPCSAVAVRPGGRVVIHMTLKGLILETQGETNTHRISGGPKSMDDTCWVVEAKAASLENAVIGWDGPVWNGLDIDSMRAMLRSLLEDRFGLVAHTEDRPVAGFALGSSKPKVREADPSNRPGCKEGPGRDGRDPRLTNLLATRLITCRNMTLTQFAAELGRSYAGIGGPVADATGLQGRFDMTINFSPEGLLSRSPGGGADGVASGPNGAISVFEALSSQLGLKLQAREVKAPVLVIDRVSERPTEN